MAGRDLTVTIDAEAAKFEAGIERARRATMRMEDQLRRADLAAAQLDKQLADEAAQAAAKRAADMEKLGRGLVVFGAATLAGLGMAAKAAIDWESAWTGVRKTVDGSPEELAQLEGELRNLAATLPTTHQEIAGVAEAAGQLGVATPDVARFTKVMIDLGETTNLTAEEAATSIAKLMNIMQTAPEDVDRLGAALVELGNNGASTEKDILEMATRIAAAGAQIGLSESDVLGLANALSSLGVEAEAGGTAISTVMSEMAKAVAQGGEGLTQFADVAGMSAAEFATAFREDPASAIVSFVTGLDRIKVAGGDVFTVLDDMGLGGIRVRDALLRMAGGGDILAESLRMGARAWQENTALVDEAAQRYDTAEAKIQIAKNTMIDLAIDIGGVLLPAISSLAEGTADLFRWFSDLPGPIKTAATVLGLIVGATSLAAGGFLLLAPKIKAAQEIMVSLAATAPRTYGALSMLGKTAGIVAGLAAVGLAIKGIGDASKETPAAVSEATESILDMAAGANETSFDKLTDDIRAFGEETFWTKDAFELFGGVMHKFGDSVRSYSDALASLVQGGNAELAAEQFGQMRRELMKAGLTAEQVDELFGSYKESLTEVSNQSRLAAESGDVNAQSLQGQGAAAGAAAEEMEEAAKAVEDQVKTMSESLASAVEPLAAWELAQQRAAETAAEAAGEGAEAWQQFVDDVEVSFSEYLAILEGQVTAQQNWATNIGIIAAQVGPDIANEIMSWGPEAAPLVQEFVDAIGTDEFGRLSPLIEASMASSQEAVANELRKWNEIAPEVLAEFGPAVVEQIAGDIAAGETTVEEAMLGLNRRITETTPGEVVVSIAADPEPYWLRSGLVREDMNDLTGSTAEPQVHLGSDSFFGAAGTVREAMADLNQQRPTPEADLHISPFESAWGESMAMVFGLDAERPVPRADLDIKALERAIDDGNAQLEYMDENDPRPEARLERERLKRDLSSAQNIINRLRGKEVNANVNPTGLANTESAINRVSRDRHVTIYTSYQGPIPYADGGIHHAASGLMTDRNPMIARGGSNIMWAEPETGWEAYIPGAMSKRPRALRILAETARRFGFGLTQGGPVSTVPAGGFGVSQPSVTHTSPAAIRAALEGLRLDFDADGVLRFASPSAVFRATQAADNHASWRGLR